MILAAFPLSAQKKTTGFNGKLLEMRELRAGESTGITGRAFAGKKLIIAEGSPSGFAPGIPLGNNRFLLSIPAESAGNDLFDAGIKFWAPVDASAKIDSRLKSQSNLSDRKAKEVHILCAPGTDEKQLRAAWNPAWGEIARVWNSDNLLRITVLANSKQVLQLAEEGWSMQLEESEGEIIPHNQVASSNGRTNTLSAAGFGWSSGLSGKGISIGIGDGGLVDYHADLESHQFNLVTTKLSSFADHPDHVSGTIAGLGLINPDRRGMAPEARILNHQTSSILTNAANLRMKENVTLTNNSYGNVLNCSKAGNYNSTSTLMDNQASSYPDLLHVVSAGNSGTSTCSPYPASYFNMAEGFPAAKNCLTVGAVNALDASASWSARGPMKDGRLKPEIVADGNDVYSSIPSDAYGTKSGTSQAAPVVTGTLALLSERYKALNAGQNPEAALLKALLCNTADDMGPANADFSYGFGRMNARKARRVLEAAQFASGNLASNSSSSISLTVPAGVSSVKIMLAWSDPAAAANPAKALINDLNLSVIRSDASTTLPWVANPSVATVSQAAVRGIDSLNNMEQVTMTVTPGEVLSIRTSSRSISGNSQKYWIVYDWIKPELVLTYPLQGQMLKTAAAIGFRWDLSAMAMSSLVLESSSDSSAWTTAQSIAAPASLYSAFTPTGTGYRKIWFRFRGVSAGQNVYSNAVRVYLSPQPSPTVLVCDRSARLSWTAVSGATRYETFKLNRTKGSWESQGLTTGLFAYFGGLENGKKELLSMRPWFGNEPGMRSLGVAATPAAGTCPWNKDLGISSLISPASGRLFTASAPASNIQLELQNYSNTAIASQSCTLNYRKADGTLLKFPLSLSLAAGQKQTFTLPVTFSNTQAGSHTLKFWLSTAGDLNITNDSLTQEIKVLPNPVERSFPLVLNFESAPAFSLNSSNTGLSIDSRMDFVSVNQARILSAAYDAPPAFGSRSLVLDKERVDGRTGTGEAIITLNLSGVPSPKEMTLSFDFMSFGAALSTGNELAIRPSDQSSWIPVKNFSQENFIPGIPRNFSGIDLLALLGNSPLSSSFQLKFSFSGQRSSELDTRGGYAADNIILTMPSGDVKALTLNLPPENCYSESEARYVKLDVQNNGSSEAQNVLVSYQLAGFDAVTDTILSIGAGEIISHTFSRSLDKNQFGRLSIRSWVNAAGDGNPANDSLPVQTAVHYKIINTFPTHESFETNAGSWAASSTRWEWGSGAGKLTAIDTAANGKKFWYSNPGISLPAEDVSYLNSPCYDLSRDGAMQISFNAAFRLNGSQDGAWVEVSQDGVNWEKLGSNGSGVNWYNESSNQWGNAASRWQSSSLKLPEAGFASPGRVRFRIALMQQVLNGGEGFALDDVHIEAAADLDNASGLDETESATEPSAWLSFGKDGQHAAMVQNDASIGSLNLQMFINGGDLRSFGDRYYLDRNFLLMPQAAPSAPQKIRLFIALADVQNLMQKENSITGFQQLGIFRYHGGNRDFSPDNNDLSPGGDFAFIPASAVLKVPTYGGHYLEFSAFGLSEFYICSRSLVDYSPGQGLRMTAADLPPHQPVEVKWLTPLDESAGRQLERKIAWLDPAAEAIYLEGLNGNSARIRLLDLKGQVVLDEVFTGFRFESRTTGLAKGLYTLRVEQESGVETFRLVLD